MREHVETVIVGGGQGGLSTSYHLTQRGLEHVIFEQADQPAAAWRKRWDSFTLITPNWMIRLPGAEYQGDDPDGFMPRDEVIEYLEDYVARFSLPIRYETRVISVEPTEAGYLVKTGGADVEAANVVVATGLNQQPRVPAFAAGLSPTIHQLHSSQYRNPEALPNGGVVVAGSAQSGCQITEELYQSGRKVYLSVGSAGRLPRRYRGKDVTWWMKETGFFDRTVDELPSPKAKFAGSAQGTGKDGGHTINLHQFARDGVVLLGHIQGTRENQLLLAPDLRESLARSDRFEADFVRQVDAYIEAHELDAPIEVLPELRDGYDAEVIPELDLDSADVSTVIWATGYSFDFSLVKLPAFDEDGFPVQQRGVTEYPGLYFVGLPFLHTVKSGLLASVGDDAAHLVSVIAARGEG